ncbi:MAG: hypothetical protein JOZ49_08935 [Mycolicibacterium sp.]|nr:hypothetical protein [Mycolicibacterium sp.]
MLVTSYPQVNPHHDREGKVRRQTRRQLGERSMTPADAPIATTPSDAHDHREVAWH